MESGGVRALRTLASRLIRYDYFDTAPDTFGLDCHVQFDTKLQAELYCKVLMNVVRQQYCRFAMTGFDTS